MQKLTIELSNSSIKALKKVAMDKGIKPADLAAKAVRLWISAHTKADAIRLYRKLYEGDK